MRLIYVLPPVGRNTHESRISPQEIWLFVFQPNHFYHMLTNLTFTGADDQVFVNELAKICKQYPFVELGILAGNNPPGTQRFPSNDWIDNIANEWHLPLSLHLCGDLVDEFLNGSSEIIMKRYPSIQLEHFQRLQINTGGKNRRYEIAFIKEFLEAEVPDVELIFQVDGSNLALIDDMSKLARNGANISFLYDMSKGKGILPEKWPDYDPLFHQGYAGGLTPDNLHEQITLIGEKVGDFESWIDIETGVRSFEKEYFDISKVKTCCEIFKSCHGNF